MLIAGCRSKVGERRKMLGRLRLYVSKLKAQRRAATGNARVVANNSEGAGKPATKKEAPEWLTRLADTLSACRVAVLNGLLLVALLVFLYAFVYETVNTEPVILPASLPDTLTKLGYTPEGFAASVRARIQEMKRKIEARGGETPRGVPSPRTSEKQIDV